MRADEEVDDNKEERVQALENLMKEKQIDFPTFVKLRNEILSEGSEKAMGKGLNFKVGKEILVKEKEQEREIEDVDDEFDELEGQEVKALDRQEVKKKGEMAPPGLIPGKKRNRDHILAEMKAARQAKKDAAEPSLGSKFRKVGEMRNTLRIETDNKGREVLVTIDENGNEKRKVRREQVDSELGKRNQLLMPDKHSKPLGMEVPEGPKIAEDDDDDDINIFDDAGDDYDPLAGLGDDDENSDGVEISDIKNVGEKKSEPGSMAPPARPNQPSTPRNYFGDSDVMTESTRPTASQDPVLLAAIKKASTLTPIIKEAENAEEAVREARRKKMLQQDDRDAQDMDMGFGSSRFEDEADFDDKKVKLSEWNGDRDDDDEDNGKGEGKGKRKRGPKKRKGDGKNAADVMKVLERRKAAEQ